MPTIYDVAREAGVSIGTVSYVINKTKRVRPETERRVLEAMRQLRYQPHAAAKALAKGCTNVVALVYPIHLDDFQMFLNTFTLAIGAVLAETDYRLTVLPLLRDETSLQELEAGINSRSMDGVILVHTQPRDPRVTLLKHAGIPFVLIGRCEDNDGLFLVDTDVEAAARLAVEHLVDLGHRSVALVGAERDDANTTSVAQRLRAAYRRSLADHDLPLDDGLVVEAAPLAQMGERVMALLRSPRRPSAIVASNEAAVMCTFKAAAALELRIPKDVAVISFADSPLFTQLAKPCTVVFDHVADLGRIATEKLLDLLEGREPQPAQQLLPPRLVARESTVGP